MTSLAKQLLSLKAPQTDEYEYSKNKESFLYNRQDAAAINCDTHWRIANRGLENLIELDENLSEYRDLFDENSKNIERATLTQGQNSELSTRLRKFLNNTIVPFFMLTSCHETLEYLVYKYKLNTYQPDDLLGALLLYHDTRLFARALQIIPNLKGLWSWLAHYQKEGVPVPKDKIVGIVLNNTVLLSFLGDKLIEINRDCKHNATKYCSFFSTLAMATLQRNHSDQFLAILYPHIHKALRKAYSIDLYMVGLVTAVYLVHQITVEEEFLDSLMKTIAKSHEKLMTKYPEQEDYLNRIYQNAKEVMSANRSPV